MKMRMTHTSNNNTHNLNRNPHLNLNLNLSLNLNGNLNPQRQPAAFAILAQSVAGGGGESPDDKDRYDVPCRSACYIGYQVAKEGDSYRSYTRQIASHRKTGAPIPKSRGSRRIAKQIASAAAEELRKEDTLLLEHCTDIACSMDERKKKRVLRMRLVMGNGFPQTLKPAGQLGEPAGQLRCKGRSVHCKGHQGRPW